MHKFPSTGNQISKPSFNKDGGPVCAIDNVSGDKSMDKGMTSTHTRLSFEALQKIRKNEEEARAKRARLLSIQSSQPEASYKSLTKPLESIPPKLIQQNFQNKNDFNGKTPSSIFTQSSFNSTALQVHNNVGASSRVIEKASNFSQKQIQLDQKGKKSHRVILSLYSTTSFRTASEKDLDRHVYSKVIGASLDSKNKKWIFPLKQYESLLMTLSSAGVRIEPSDLIPPRLLRMIREPHIKTSDSDRDIFEVRFKECIDAVLRESLFPFQRESILKAVTCMGGRLLLADDMGLGKSLQALAFAAYYRSDWPLLIISPASMVATWAEQLHRWLPSVSNSKVAVVFDGKSASEHLDAHITIVSFDLVCKVIECSDRKNAKNGTASPFFRVIILDESHAIKADDSKRSKTIVPIIQCASRVILLSGTPALSRPIELYNQIRCVNPEIFKNRIDYGRRYCNLRKVKNWWDYSGSSNERELNILLEKHVMIRRTKSEILTQLPRKLRRQVILTLSSDALSEYKRNDQAAHNLLEGERNLSLDSIADFPDHVIDSSLSKISAGQAAMQLWRKTSSLKLKAVCDYIGDLVGKSVEKMLVFAHHKDIMDGLAEYFLTKNLKYLRIDGSTATSKRQDICDAFQNDPNVKIALLSITAASTGLTLTAATIVIFAELFWIPGILLQAEDRAHRIGQHSCVNVHYLLAKGTYDDCIWPLISRKLSLLEKCGLGSNEFAKIDVYNHDINQTRIDQYFKSSPLVTHSKNDNYVGESALNKLKDVTKYERADDSNVKNDVSLDEFYLEDFDISEIEI